MVERWAGAVKNYFCESFMPAGLTPMLADWAGKDIHRIVGGRALRIRAASATGGTPVQAFFFGTFVGNAATCNYGNLGTGI